MTSEIIEEHGGRTGISNKLRHSQRSIGPSDKKNKMPERREREEVVKPYSLNTKSERAHCGELSSRETVARIAPENPALDNKEPSKTFKRPKSYIHGRVKSASDRCGARGNPGPDTTQSDKSSGARDLMKPLLPEGTTSQDVREMAALDRINFLNKKLKAQESTREYFKPFPEDDCPDMVLEPDPPAWSYETYSGSEKQEATLSGLKSYIRANESHLAGGCEVDVQDVKSPPGSPQESLVTYLDGVLSSRYPLRRCSMTFEPYSDGEQAQGGDGSVSTNSGHTRHSSKSRKEKSHSRNSAGQHRLRSSERRSDIGVLKEDPTEGDFEEVGVKVDGRKVASGEMEDRNESNVLESRHQSDALVNTSRRSNRERFSSSSHSQRNSQSGSCSTIKTESQAYPGMAGNASFVFKSMHPTAWGAEESEARSSSSTGDTSLASPVSTKPYILGKGARLSDQGNFSHDFNSDPHEVQGVGRLLIHTSRAVVPMLQAQETSLAVDDGYLLSAKDDEDPVNPPYDCPEEEEKDSKSPRLIVQKHNRSSARVWSRTNAKSEKHSFSDLDEDENVDTYDEGDGNEAENEANDDEYQDLLIHTELSQGSKVKVSDNNGPIAAIENEKFDNPEISQFQSVTLSPETDEVNTLTEQLAKKVNNKSQNNDKYDSNDTSSSSVSQDKRTNENTIGKDAKMKRQSLSTKGSQRTDTKHDRKSSKSKSAWKLNTFGNKIRHKLVNDNARARRTGPASSPPKLSSALSPGRRLRQDEVSGKKDEIKIPADHDGKTRVLLVLRTPPKKTKADNDGREKSARRSPERKITSASMQERSPQRSTSSSRSALGRLSSHKTSEEGKSRGKYSDTENFEKQNGGSSEIGERMMRSSGFLYDSSPEFTDETAPRRTRNVRRRAGRKNKFDSMVPQPCGQEGHMRFPAADIDEEGEEEKRATEDARKTGSARTRKTFVDHTSEPAELATRTHSPCKFSLYQPCRHGELEHLPDPDLQAKPQLERGKGTRGFRDGKPEVVDHGPCSFSQVQPCSHVTHSLCQFDRFKPCVHEECDLPETAPLVSDIEKNLFTSKQEKTNKRSGFVYNSKKLQDKFGQHSPCVYDRFKPCLHEEVVGPLDNVKNKAGISLLPKTLNKNDPKAKRKETVLNLVQCKFNRYTPCFHEDEIKVNKALGVKASLLAEKAKLRQAAPTLLGTEEAEDPCRFGPYTPCFCQEKVEASKAKVAEISENVEVEQSRFDEQEAPVKSKRAKSDGSNTFGTKMKVETPNKILSTWSWFNKASISSQDEKREERAKRSTGNELTLAPADGPGLKVKPPTPRAKRRLGTGEEGIPKDNNDFNAAGGEAEISAAPSFLSRISRAWFSSARAQVARLTPPQPRVIITPTLRTEPDLGSSGRQFSSTDAKVPLGQPRDEVNQDTGAGLTAAAGSYSILKQPRQRSPRKHTWSSTNRESPAVPGRQSMNCNVQVQSLEEGENPFKRQLLHEISLADSFRSCESYETDTSQGTDSPEMIAIHSGARHKRDLNVAATDISLTETCSGQPASLAYRPISPQLWTREHAMPEDFLVLTSNIYPMSHETEETAGMPKLEDADQEVLSADPVLVHFSDVAKTNRGNEHCGGQFLHESNEKLYNGQAGLILCHSSQRPPGRTLGGPADPHRPGCRHGHSSRESNGAILAQDQSLKRAEIEEAVETFLGELNAFDNGQPDSGNTCIEHYQSGEEVRPGTAASTFTTRGDVCADPLSEHRYPRNSRSRKQSLAAAQDVDREGERINPPRRSAYEEYASKKGRFRGNEGVVSGQNFTLRMTDDLKVRGLSEQNETIGDPQADVTSKVREAVVVAAAELMSYRSFLDTINKFAKADAGLSVSTSESSSGYGTEKSRRLSSKFLPGSHCSSSTDSQSPGNSEYIDAEQSDGDNQSDDTSCESVTKSGDFCEDTSAGSRSEYDHSSSILKCDGNGELLGDSETADTIEDIKKSFLKRQEIKKSFLKRQEKILEKKGDNFPDSKRDVELRHENCHHSTIYRDKDELLRDSETADTIEDIKKSFLKRQEKILEKKGDNFPDSTRDVELRHENRHHNAIYRDKDDAESFPKDHVTSLKPSCRTLITEDRCPAIVHNVCNQVSVEFGKQEGKQAEEEEEQEEEEEEDCSSLDRDGAQEIGEEDTRGGNSMAWEVQTLGEDSSSVDEANSSETDDTEDTDEDEEEEDEETEDEQGEEGDSESNKS